MSMIKDWFLFTYIYTVVYSFFLFLFDNWLQIKWRIEEESKCLRQKLDQFFVLFFCCLFKIFIGEVCVNTCRRKYCVSKIDKISFHFCFSYYSLTSPKNRSDSLWIRICRLILRLHIHHLELHLIFIYILVKNMVSNNHHFLSSEVT